MRADALLDCRTLSTGISSTRPSPRKPCGSRWSPAHLDPSPEVSARLQGSVQLLRPIDDVVLVVVEEGQLQLAGLQGDALLVRGTASADAFLFGRLSPPHGVRASPADTIIDK